MVADTQTRQVTVYQAAPPAAMGFEETMRIAETFAASGFFSDAKQAAQCVVKIMAGRELGFGPFASMQGIYVIQGKVALAANLMAAAIKRSGKYNYRVLKLEREAVEIAFYEWGEEIGRSSFTLEDAKAAQTQNTGKFPRNMLYARAMSNGARWYCADIFAGGAYVPEELGAMVDAEGDYVQAEAVSSPAVKPATERPAQLIKALADWHEEASRAQANGIEPAVRDIDRATVEELRESSLRLFKLRGAATEWAWPQTFADAWNLGLEPKPLGEPTGPKALARAAQDLAARVTAMRAERAAAGEEGPAPAAILHTDFDAEVTEEESI